MNQDGTMEYKELPLCIPVGGLIQSFSADRTREFDKNGIGVTLYFKLLKSFTCLMIFFACVSASYGYFYFSGSAGNAESETNYLAKFLLGNIGESSRICVEQDIARCDFMKIVCPSGTLIS